MRLPYICIMCSHRLSRETPFTAPRICLYYVLLVITWLQVWLIETQYPWVPIYLARVFAICRALRYSHISVGSSHPASDTNLQSILAQLVLLHKTSGRVCLRPINTKKQSLHRCYSYLSICNSITSESVLAKVGKMDATCHIGTGRFS